MITLFKKNVHSFFSTLPPTTTSGGGAGGGGDCKLPISSNGLVTATRDPDRPPNVVESSMLMKPPLSPSAASGRNTGFTQEIGDEVDGMMSCIFESSDDREIHDNDHENFGDGIYNRKTVNWDWRRRSRCRRGEWRKMRSFPPPLSSLNGNGEPNFFLRPVRKDGRLELTEVRIHRPQILHASRHDGRLTLQFVPDRHSFEEEEEEIGEQEVQEQVIVEETEEMKEQSVTEEEEEEEIGEKEVQEQVIVEETDSTEEMKGQSVREEEEEEGGEMGNGEWRIGKEGLRRCHQMVNQHHHHHHQHNHHGGHSHHLRMCGISTVV